MGQGRQMLAEIVDQVAKQTRDYLSAEMHISVREIGPVPAAGDRLRLHDLTAIVSLGGRLNLQVAFSFEGKLADALCAVMTADMDGAEQDWTLYRSETAAEIINTILGACATELWIPNDPPILLSPPVVLEQSSSILKTRKAIFYGSQLNTDFGTVYIYAVSPPGLFGTTEACVP